MGTFHVQILALEGFRLLFTHQTIDARCAKHQVSVSKLLADTPNRHARCGHKHHVSTLESERPHQPSPRRHNYPSPSPTEIRFEAAPPVKAVTSADGPDLADRHLGSYREHGTGLW